LNCANDEDLVGLMPDAWSSKELQKENSDAEKLLC